VFSFVFGDVFENSQRKTREERTTVVFFECLAPDRKQTVAADEKLLKEKPVWGGSDPGDR
jgi:hypothetical protein